MQGEENDESSQEVNTKETRTEDEETGNSEVLWLTRSSKHTEGYKGKKELLAFDALLVQRFKMEPNTGFMPRHLLGDFKAFDAQRNDMMMRRTTKLRCHQSEDPEPEVGRTVSKISPHPVEFRVLFVLHCAQGCRRKLKSIEKIHLSPFTRSDKTQSTVYW